MKTSDLQGAALDYAVAHCENLKLGTEQYVVGVASEDGTYYKPSTNWAQGGPIIEREKISLFRYGESHSSVWTALAYFDECYFDISSNDGTGVEGETPLIAAMRCYVASKLGDEVEIPEKLL